MCLTLLCCSQLFNTGVQSVPDWAQHFHALEFLYDSDLPTLRFRPFADCVLNCFVPRSDIEGKSGDANLKSLPESLFDSMASLAFLHLGSHAQLTKLPAFTGLVNVKSLTLALLPSVQQLPSFESLRRLERLQIVGLSALSSLPDMSPLSNLVLFSLSGRGQMCCNGFLGGACDLTSALCVANPVINQPTASCLQAMDGTATAGTVAMFQHFQSSVCLYVSMTHVDPITKANADVCGGVRYRKCAQGAYDNPGICVNERLGVLMCHHGISNIVARQKQIQRGIGDPCDPIEESWLGCNRTDH